jgi:hypothetical protein
VKNLSYKVIAELPFINQAAVADSAIQNLNLWTKHKTSPNKLTPSLFQCRGMGIFLMN